jgi:hypothetical protein
MPLFLALPPTVAAQAPEERFSAGLQLAVAKDLPDRIEQQEAAEFLIGPAFVLPLRAAIFRGVLDLRVGLELYLAAGDDRVIWEDGGDTFYQDDLAARVRSAQLLIGPEVRAPTGEGSPVRPYLTAGLGPGRARTMTALEGEAAALLSSEADSGEDFPAWTAQWSLAVGVAGGVRVDFGRVAAEVESGYTVSFLQRAPLSNTGADYNARREAYNLDVFRIGLGLVYPF